MCRRPSRPYLAFIVGLHVATALAMIIYFWRDWVRIVGGLLSSLRDRQIATADQKLAWMIILATIPVGVAGLALEHLFRVVFSKPIPTALFLAVNGVILLTGERKRRQSRAAGGSLASGDPRPAGGSLAPGDEPRAATSGRHQLVAAGSPLSGLQQAPSRRPASHQASRPVSRPVSSDPAIAADQRLATMGYGKAILIGASQVLALLPGISRDGVVTVFGMGRGLRREDAVRYSFLLSAPVILAAGALKIPDLMGPLGNGIRGQVLVGSVLSGIGAYLSIRFLVRYFARARTLTPFGIYCLIAGLGSLIYLTVR
jgi:undecaprenyl-diphosphatase